MLPRGVTAVTGIFLVSGPRAFASPCTTLFGGIKKAASRHSAIIPRCRRGESRKEKQKLASRRPRCLPRLLNSFPWLIQVRQFQRARPALSRSHMHIPTFHGPARPALSRSHMHIPTFHGPARPALSRSPAASHSRARASLCPTRTDSDRLGPTGGCPPGHCRLPTTCCSACSTAGSLGHDDPVTTLTVTDRDCL